MYFGYQYVMHGGARDLKTEEAAFTIDAKTLINEFETNTQLATQKYLNKAIEINGTITTINESNVTLEEVIFCQFKESNPNVKSGQKTTIKGRFIGYDDLLGEIKLDQCFVK